MVQAGVVGEFEDGAESAGLGVGGAVDDEGDAAEDDGAGAHGAGFEGDV
jgi:hypothetical protein